MRDGRTDGRTREDNATHPLDAGRLSFAICIKIDGVRYVYDAAKSPFNKKIIISHMVIT